jgi:hypothetical protein
MAMQKNDDQHITREFWQRQGRQILALAAALFLVILLAVVYKRHDLFGEYSGFTAINWRCPSCNKYLGKDINKRACRHCKTRLR